MIYEPGYHMTHRTTTQRLGRTLSVCLLAAGLLAGCAAFQEPDNIQFGDSVRHMIALQTTDPDPGARGLDGEKAEQTMRAYRGNVGSPQNVENANIEF